MDSRRYTLNSTRSLQNSLKSIHDGSAGLSRKRQNLLARVPGRNEWARLQKDSVKINDLAYLTAAVGDEFALLRGKRSDIIYHGNRYECCFSDELAELLIKGTFEIIAHSHPSEDTPIPSAADRNTLRLLGQRSSIIISATTAKQVVFTENEFDDLLN